MIRNSVLHFIKGAFLLICFILDHDQDVGINAKFIIFTSALIELVVFIPFIMVSLVLCTYRAMRPGLYMIIYNLLLVWYSPWLLYCMIRFFNSDNDTKNEAGFLYAGMLYLLIEAFVLITAITCLLWLLMCLLVFALYLLRSNRAIESEQLDRNIRIRDLIQSIDMLHITGRRFNEEDMCCICMGKSVSRILFPNSIECRVFQELQWWRQRDYKIALR